MPEQRIILRDERGTDHEVTITDTDTVTIGGRTLTIQRTRTGELRIAEQTVWAAGPADARWVFANGHVYTFESQRRGATRRKRVGQDENLFAPMPATVVKLHVSPGDEVQAGQLLLVLEAMKMELPVRAAGDARVDAVHCNEGDLVQPGQSLIELTPRPHARTAEGDPK